MQATARQKKIDYQFAPMPKGSALMLWPLSNDFTPILFMHICEQLNGYSKELLTYKITDAALIELYQVCQRTITRARAKLTGADVVEAIEIKKGVFCYRPSKTSRLKRQMCQEVVTDVSKAEREPKPDSDKAQTQTGGGSLEYKPKNINNPPTTASITNRKLGTKEGEGKFNKVKQALEAKDNSYIPTDEQIQEVLEQIPADRPIDALIYAIRSVDIPRIANLPKLFDAARKKEGQFWELIKGYPEYLQAEERSKRDRQTTRHEIEQGRGPDQSKREPERRREKPEAIDKDHQRIMAAIAGIGKSAVKPVTEFKPWSREDALKLDRETREDAPR